VADEDGGEYQSEKVLCCVVCAGLSVGVVASAGGVFPSGQHLLVGPPPVWNQIQAHNKSLPSPYELG
jgi:hypothetical protein